MNEQMDKLRETYILYALFQELGVSLKKCSMYFVVLGMTISDPQSGTTAVRKVYLTVATK